MNEKKKYLLKNTAILTVSNFASKILVFFLIPLYTGILTTSDYGTYDFVSSTVSLIFPILTLNITDAVMRFSMEEQYSKDDIGRIGLKYIARSALIILLCLCIVRAFAFFPDIHKYLIYVFFYYLTSSTYNFLVQYAKGCEQVRDMAIVGVLISICTIIFNITSLSVFSMGLAGFFLASILAEAIACIYFMVRLKLWKRVRFGKNNKALEKEMLIYCVPLIATALSWWINSVSDKYVVTYMCGIAANGLLAISYKLPGIINILQNIFTQAWQISAVKEYGKEETAIFYGNTFNVINTLMCVACTWIILLTRPLALLLFANEFYYAWRFVPFLLISSVINCASGLLGPILSAAKNSKAMMWSAMIGAGANIGLNFLLVWLVGIQGATIATVLASLIIFFVRKIAVGKEININQYAIVLMTWSLLCIQSIVEIYIGLYWIEAIIMMILLAINISTVKKILQVVKQLAVEVKIKVKGN